MCRELCQRERVNALTAGGEGTQYKLIRCRARRCNDQRSGELRPLGKKRSRVAEQDGMGARVNQLTEGHT